MTPSDTKERLLDAAERLFADRGVGGTSLRDITSAAEANLAAVNYHFGSKNELALAVVRRRIDPVNEERLRLLDEAEAEAAGRPLSMHTISRVFLEPAMKLFEEPACLCLMGRLHQEPTEVLEPIVSETFQEVVARFIFALGKARPDLGPRELLLRGHFMVGAMVHTLTHSDFLGTFDEGFASGVDHDLLLDSLVRFVAAGLDAPAPRVRQ